MFHDKIYTANKYSSNISCLLEFYWQKKRFHDYLNFVRQKKARGI